MSKSDDMRKLIDLANNNKMVSETYVTERDNESSPFKAFASWGNADILSESERVSVVYVDGIAGIKYTNAEDAKEAVALMKKKHPKKNFEIKQEMRESDDYSGNMKSLPKFHQVAGAPHRHRDDPDAYLNNPNRTDWSVPIVAGDVWERWNNPEMKVVIRGRVGGNGNIIISEPDDLDSTIMFAEGPFRKTYVKSKDASVKLEEATLMESARVVYVVLTHDLDREDVWLDKAFTTYEAAKAYRDELAGINNANDHYYKIETVEVDF